MSGITLYSTNCPKCVVLEHRLKDACLEFEICRDMELMHKKGFVSAPMLEVNESTMNFVDAIQWLNSFNK